MKRLLAIAVAATAMLANAQTSVRARFDVYAQLAKMQFGADGDADSN